ncbi:MAG: ABC transporter permease [Lacunisphaera sp.]
MHDLRYAFRQLAKSPGFTAVAVLTLALGIGATTALFSVINSVLLRSLAFPNADRLTLVWETNVQQGVKRTGPSGPNFYDLREQSRLYQDMAAFEIGTGTVTGRGDPQQIPAMRVTANFFSVLNITPALGRTFVPEDGRGGRQARVVVSHSFWQNALGSDPHIVGKTVMIDLIPYQVMGVLRRDFWLPFQSDLFVPWPDRELRTERGRLAHDLGVFGRLNPGVTAAQAEGELNIIYAQLRAAHSELTGWIATVEPLQTVLGESIRPALIVLFCGVACVLLIACANVANLLLARAIDRSREVAVRAALGASPWRVLRQFLAESLVLSLAAGALGTLFAAWGVALLSAIVPATIPVPDAGAEVALRAFSIDGRVLAFSLVVSLLTGLLFGIAPAIHALKTNLIEGLKHGSRATVGGGRRLREILLAANVALALVLLAGAGLMLKSFSQLRHADLGFQPDHLLTLEMELPTDTSYKRPQQQSAFFAAVIERVQSLPGVKSAAVTSTLPLHNQNQQGQFLIENDPALPANELLQSDLRQVSPAYFKTMAIPLKVGRLLDRQDNAEINAPRVGVIDEAFARHFFPNGNPLGRRLLFGKTKFEIVGIVGDVKQVGGDREVRPTFYATFMQSPAARMNLVVRSTVDPAALVASVKQAIGSIDPDQPVYRVASMSDVVAESTATPRLTFSLLSAFAVVAVGLAAVGIYGVMTYSISQRTREIGIRMALGATSAAVLAQVLRQGMKIVALGLVAGFALVFALGRLVNAMLYRTSAHDPSTLFTVTMILAGVALLACWLPARRATKVDPMVALRAE